MQGTVQKVWRSHATQATPGLFLLSTSTKQLLLLENPGGLDEHKIFVVKSQLEVLMQVDGTEEVTLAIISRYTHKTLRTCKVTGSEKIQKELGGFVTLLTNPCE